MALHAFLAPDPIYVVNTKEAARRHAELPLAVRQLLKLCDGRRPGTAVMAMSSLAPVIVQRALLRLCELRVLGVMVDDQAAVERGSAPAELLRWVELRAHPSAPPAEPREAVSFSDEEEAFFARPVELPADEEEFWDEEIA